MVVDTNCGARTFYEIMQTCSFLPLKDVMGHVRAKLRTYGMTMKDAVRKTREMDREMDSVPLQDAPNTARGHGSDSAP